MIEFVQQLKGINALSKHEQLVLGIKNAINSGELKIGDQLPSINTMVEEIGFARKTIVKAYDELKDKGLIESKKTKGYFVVSNKTNQFLKIALIMYSLQRFQQEFYDTLRKRLEDKVQIDVFFHHNNEEVFETIFANIAGKYGMYVVAPIENEQCALALEEISPDKLIIVDRFLELGPDYTYVVQEFIKSTHKNLTTLLPKIKRYKQTILFFRDDQDYPLGILKAFTDFAKENDLPYAVEKRYQADSIKKNILYLTINDTDLWNLMKDCRANDFRIGKDLGILSFNDHIVKELVSGGISTISTNFKEMASMTATHIKKPGFSKQIIPTDLIDRGSL